MRIRIRLITFFDADLDPVPHQSDENLRSMIYTLHGSILSLHGSFDFTAYPDLAFDFVTGPNPAFHSKSDPDPTSP